VMKICEPRMARGQDSNAERRALCRLASLQICVHEIDQILSELGRNLFLRAISQVEANVRLKHFAHQAVDPAAHRRQQHQLVTAIVAGGKRALDRFELAAYFFYALQKLYLFPFLVGHFAIPPLDNTIPGYRIN
jgi:hypothetical protein